VPEGSPDHHAPTQIQTLAHRPAAAGGHQINGTINVTTPDTVVHGLGIATLVSNGGNTILSIADVNGIQIGGLLFDAVTTNSAQLVQFGPAGSSASHASDPTVLSDVFVRIGGATVGKATQTLSRQQQQRHRRRPVALARGPRQQRSRLLLPIRDALTRAAPWPI
jgi:hypothetical protein